MVAFAPVSVVVPEYDFYLSEQAYSQHYFSESLTAIGNAVGNAVGNSVGALSFAKAASVNVATLAYCSPGVETSAPGVFPHA